MDVLGYGEVVSHPGLNILDGPGNDPVSVTVLAAAATHLILFTTGRGTPLCSPVPTLKIATNTPLARAKPHWIDFDAGVLLDGEPLDATAERLLMQVLDVASGRRRTRSEENGFRAIALFKHGVTV